VTSQLLKAAYNAMYAAKDDFERTDFLLNAAPEVTVLTVERRYRTTCGEFRLRIRQSPQGEEELAH